MATSYDNDSSDSEAESFTETSTLLGYASKEPTDDAISHLGGTPVRHHSTAKLSTEEKDTILTLFSPAMARQ
jgi:hypothetical protein